MSNAMIKKVIYHHPRTSGVGKKSKSELLKNQNSLSVDCFVLLDIKQIGQTTEASPWPEGCVNFLSHCVLTTTFIFGSDHWIHKEFTFAIVKWRNHRSQVDILGSPRIFSG